GPRGGVLPNHRAIPPGAAAARGLEGGVGGKGGAVSRMPPALGRAAIGGSEGPHGDCGAAVWLRCENEGNLPKGLRRDASP
ncbi:unnamed protein product, partial [Ectocarpus sp. 6 AP-2014]